MEVDISRVPALIMSAFVLHNFLQSPNYKEGDTNINTKAYHTLYDKAVKSVKAYGRGPRDALSTATGLKVC